MANYAVWNNRLRHEWLSKPRKGKYLSKRKRARIGLEEALVRSGERTSDDGQSRSETQTASEA